MGMTDNRSQDRRPLHPSARSSARLGLGEVDVIAPGLLHVRLAGSVQLEHIEPMMLAATEEIMKGNRVLLAIDADDVHAYKSEVRKIFQGWMRDAGHDIEGVWVLFRSPVIKMGISLVNSFVGGNITGYSDPEAFDEALDDAARRARRGWLRKDGVYRALN